MRPAAGIRARCTRSRWRTPARRCVAALQDIAGALQAPPLPPPLCAVLRTIYPHRVPRPRRVSLVARRLDASVSPLRHFACGGAEAGSAKLGSGADGAGVGFVSCRAPRRPTNNVPEVLLKLASSLV